MSALVSSSMVHEFDLHPSLFLAIHNPVDLLRVDADKRRDMRVALHEGLAKVDLVALGASLDIERASAKRWGVTVSAEAQKVMDALLSSLKNLKSETVRPLDERILIADSDEARATLEEFEVDLFCKWIDGFYRAVRKSECILAWLPELAGLSGTQGIEVGGLHHASAHGALCKFGLQLASHLSSVVRLGKQAMPETSKPKRQPQRGREQPGYPEDLGKPDPDILRALLEKWPSDGLLGKQIAVAADCSEGHVRHRIADLRKWKLVSSSRNPYMLTELGAQWARELEGTPE